MNKNTKGHIHMREKHSSSFWSMYYWFKRKVTLTSIFEQDRGVQNTQIPPSQIIQKSGQTVKKKVGIKKKMTCLQASENTEAARM